MAWQTAIPALLIAATLAGEEITLASGSVVEGEILSESASEVRVRVVQNGMSAERTWPRGEILGIVRGPTARQQAVADLRAEAGALTGSVPATAWLRLSRRARSLDEPTLARTWAVRAIQCDRTQAEAQRQLGREEVHGVWMRPHEAAAARGQVRHDGRLMTWNERERLVAEAAERRRQQAEALAERRRAAAERAAAAPLATADYDLPQRWSWRADTPGQVLWWGGLPRSTWPTAGCAGPLLRVGASGRWGGVDWNLHLNW